jgi:BirA family transcriptional regulator, biotin operon repressor / biotin---[acetyl-CoA-carboxylase] ligase
MAVSIASDVNRPDLLPLLADGRLHTGERLARELKISRAGVRKAVEQLRAFRVEVQALPRRGYRLAQPVELLDAQRIVAALPPERKSALHQLELLFAVDSTNSRLLAATAPPPGRADVCIAELQYAGRGRRGRHWISPFGSGIALSAAWTFNAGTRSVSSLSLAVGVAVSRALVRLRVPGVRLKWPNDIWFEDRKIGGVLTELRAEPNGRAHVVLGVGLNVALPPAARRELEKGGLRAAAVADTVAAAPSRNLLAGTILDELLSMLSEFERAGFAAFRDAWTALDALGGRPVQVLLGAAAVTGTARGVDCDGALLIDTGNGMQRFVSGEASLRLSEGDT